MSDLFWEKQFGRYTGLSRQEPVLACDISTMELTDRPSPETSRDHWGYHLMMNLSECDHDVDDPDIVAEYLRQMVDVLKMTAIGEPVVHQFTGEGDEGRGTTGFQIISTSHISFHSDDDKWSAYIDVFSCKTFEEEAAIKFTEEYFKPKRIGTQWVYRDAGPWPEEERKNERGT